MALWGVCSQPVGRPSLMAVAPGYCVGVLAMSPKCRDTKRQRLGEVAGLKGITSEALSSVMKTLHEDIMLCDRSSSCVWVCLWVWVGGGGGGG